MAKWYRAETLGETKRISTGSRLWDSLLFVADNPKAAKPYGDVVYLYESDSDTKVLREGSREFNKISKEFTKEFGKVTRDNIMNWFEHIVIEAKDRGFDAVWFKRQSDVGTAVINKGKFHRVGEYGLSREINPNLKTRVITMVGSGRRIVVQE